MVSSYFVLLLKSLSIVNDLRLLISEAVTNIIVHELYVVAPHKKGLPNGLPFVCIISAELFWR